MKRFYQKFPPVEWVIPGVVVKHLVLQGVEMQLDEPRLFLVHKRLGFTMRERIRDNGAPSFTEKERAAALSFMEEARKAVLCQFGKTKQEK